MSKSGERRRGSSGKIAREEKRTSVTVRKEKRTAKGWREGYKGKRR